jgi:hypothetical protein
MNHDILYICFFILGLSLGYFLFRPSYSNSARLEMKERERARMEIWHEDFPEPK